MKVFLKEGYDNTFRVVSVASVCYDPEEEILTITDVCGEKYFTPMSRADADSIMESLFSTGACDMRQFETEC